MIVHVAVVVVARERSHMKWWRIHRADCAVLQTDDRLCVDTQIVGSEDRCGVHVHEDIRTLEEICCLSVAQHAGSRIEVKCSMAFPTVTFTRA